MATDNKSKPNRSNKKGKHRYLPQNKPVKKKGSYPLLPGVQGFFITCDGGKERQASHEAINVIDSFYEDLLLGRDSSEKQTEFPNKPLNKKTKFVYSESSSSDDDNEEEEDVNFRKEPLDIKKKDNEEEKDKQLTDREADASNENAKKGKADPPNANPVHDGHQIVENMDRNKDVKYQEDQDVRDEKPPAKKQRVEADVSKCKNVICDKVKSVDQLIEAELAELGDRNKRRFSFLDSGCNGVAFVQMRRRDGDPSPKDIVQHMMTSVASKKKHVARFMLRVLPVELTCYASEEEIARAIKPLIVQYFPVETHTPQKFSVLYDARANTGIDRMKIIDTVAKSVPVTHKVDLSNPDVNIVVQIVKTVCLIGVVEKYKELAKYNLRQLSSS